MAPCRRAHSRSAKNRGYHPRYQVPDPPTRLPNRLEDSRARSLPERLWLYAALTISPSIATAGRQHPLCAATAPCTQPNLLESSPHVSFPCLSSLV